VLQEANIVALAKTASMFLSFAINNGAGRIRHIESSRDSVEAPEC
jgi:hypothetical protein